jgi:hypothetical protein
MNYRKPAALILTGSMVVVIWSHEAIENPHVDQRQYEEPSRLTYEFPNSTVTATISYPLFPGDFYSKTPDPKFRII